MHTTEVGKFEHTQPLPAGVDKLEEEAESLDGPLKQLLFNRQVDAITELNILKAS